MTTPEIANEVAAYRQGFTDYFKQEDPDSDLAGPSYTRGWEDASVLFFKPDVSPEHEIKDILTKFEAATKLTGEPDEKLGDWTPVEGTFGLIMDVIHRRLTDARNQVLGAEMRLLLSQDQVLELLLGFQEILRLVVDLVMRHDPEIDDIKFLGAYQDTVFKAIEEVRVEKAHDAAERRARIEGSGTPLEEAPPDEGVADADR
jgi:hypothetical protein